MTDHINLDREMRDLARCGVAVVAMLVVGGLGLGVMLCAAF